MHSSQPFPNGVHLETLSLPGDFQTQIEVALAAWQADGHVRRLWAGDASLWTGTDEAEWLGWLTVVDEQVANAHHLRRLADDVKSAGMTHALLLGMGGSSLAPEVLKMTFGDVNGFPPLHVLDSTDPSQIRAFAGRVDLAKTLVMVASKSGSTLEPNILKQYFFERIKEAVGADQVGSRFIAITDPGSQLDRLAQQEQFRHIFYGVPSIGGRYSALSNFGMVPAVVMGLDAVRFLERAQGMVRACSAEVAVAENPGVRLGLALGELAQHGRDKVTLITSPPLWDLGAWLEQLLAESTGKIGKGLIPVDREALGALDVYGDDRVFVYIRLTAAPDAAQDAAVDALERAGQAVIRIPVADIEVLGQEFYRWEVATAVAGAVLGINPFDQPDVEASKVVTRDLTSAYEATGALPPETPLLEADGITLYADPQHAAALSDAVGGDASLVAYLRAHLQRVQPGDYVAILAYLHMCPDHEARLQSIRHFVRDTQHVATCLGFGPRFLHSTGQAYKGGPNTGVFLQITCDEANDVPVPGQQYTFGVVKAAQARGDFQVLADRHRRALRVHLGPDVQQGLAVLETAVRQALGDV
ncbi:bifunctional transaldolase/phosoglucose isomerase [Candidatus Entotheonella palauensis]|uniref:Glucose-6-phosphate isomerase n=1 Tax=Candidatus Entotheonella gemina TaxID=1429439 RepID=W4MCB1_9BACT|nr:bifunctional transaldolase/phosoglucose isomerase [Candidatus Entotheonella palauensis]ETX07805.1 MAG: transaldolase [Candidatus Entotheonella gemina]